RRCAVRLCRCGMSCVLEAVGGAEGGDLFGVASDGEVGRLGGAVGGVGDEEVDEGFGGRLDDDVGVVGSAALVGPAVAVEADRVGLLADEAHDPGGGGGQAHAVLVA